MKLRRHGDIVYGIAGNLAAGLKTVAWLERSNGDYWAAHEADGDCPLDDETQVIEFNLHTGDVRIWEHPGFPIPIYQPIAIGSGAAVAYGALHMGATAVQAVKAAAKYDDGTDEPVTYYSQWLDHEPRRV